MQRIKAKYIPIVVAALMAFAAVLPLHSRKVVLKVDEKAIAAQKKLQKEALADSSLVGEAAHSAVRLFGYDKPHDAAKESVFVTNLLENDTIESVSFQVDYMSVGGESLHSRTVNQPCRIPPGQTMRLLYPSWDATHTFYYYRTPPKRKQGLTPYKIAVTVLKVGLFRWNPSLTAK